MNWSILTLGILANASASILIKLSGDDQATGLASLRLWGFNINLATVAGLFFYGVAFLAYAISLRELPLHVAQPIMTAGAIVLVSVFSFTLGREHISFSALLGIALVIAGVVALSTSAAKS